MISTRKKLLSFAVTALGLLVLFVVAVNTGSLKVTPVELFKGLFVEYDPNVATIYDLRFPRIFIALLGGAAMAVSGVLLQAVMKNPLADPGIIGISSGASLVAVLITAFFPALFFFTPMFAFIGGMIAFALVYSLSYKGGLHDWFLGTKMYKKHLESFVQKKGMLMQTKLTILTTVTLLMGFGFFMMLCKGILIPCIVLAIVWVCHVIYFLFGVKTIRPEKETKA